MSAVQKVCFWADSGRFISGVFGIQDLQGARLVENIRVRGKPRLIMPPRQTSAVQQVSCAVGYSTFLTSALCLLGQLETKCRFYGAGYSSPPRGPLHCLAFFLQASTSNPCCFRMGIRCLPSIQYYSAHCQSLTDHANQCYCN